MRTQQAKAFTLVELLIVVLIIAILSAIATPNFLEYQTRAKVSRAKNDMRVMATALEAYVVDRGSYPYARDAFLDTNIFPVSQRVTGLTTPIAYITTLPQDTFPPKAAYFNGLPEDFDTFDYYDRNSDKLEQDAGDTVNSTRGAYYRLSSSGPDLYHSFSIFDFGGVEYDPTNGTISDGDISRLGDLYITTDTNINYPGFRY